MVISEQLLHISGNPFDVNMLTLKPHYSHPVPLRLRLILLFLLKHFYILVLLTTRPLCRQVQYLRMACGVSPMMKVVCLVWRTLVLVKVTGWSLLAFSCLTAEGQGWLSGELADRLWYKQELRMKILIFASWLLLC